jgi:hypothetical protein
MRKRTRMIEPFPPFFPRNIDLLTPLSLQEKIDPNLELFYCRGHVSVPLEEATGGKEVKTDLGVRIRASPIHRAKTEILFGWPRPFGGAVSQREILEDVVANTSTRDVPEVILENRGVIEDLPRSIQEVDPFQGYEEVLYLQHSVGNRYRSLRHMLQLPLSNPYRIAREALILHGVVKPWDPVFKRMKSVLKTDWIGVGLDKELRKGWMELEAQHLPLQRAIVRERWWQDTAIPHPISSIIDSRTVKAQVYILDKLDEVIAI